VFETAKSELAKLRDDNQEYQEILENLIVSGGHTVEEQKKEGGSPDECIIYSLYVYHLMPDDEELLELRKACESGKLICGDCKKKAIKFLNKFLKNHKKNRKSVKKKIGKIIEDHS
ncbi:hypothetical protein AKJ48_03340, partial [candidate division MSBL1 archaeon SCGC-AAA261O19]